MHAGQCKKNLQILRIHLLRHDGSIEVQINPHGLVLIQIPVRHTRLQPAPAMLLAKAAAAQRSQKRWRSAQIRIGLTQLLITSS